MSAPKSTARREYEVSLWVYSDVLTLDEIARTLGLSPGEGSASKGAVVRREPPLSYSMLKVHARNVTGLPDPTEQAAWLASSVVVERVASLRRLDPQIVLEVYLAAFHSSLNCTVTVPRQLTELALAIDADLKIVTYPTDDS